MLPRHLEKNELIQKLIDARVLHLVRKGYADKDNPGVRYSIYTLDYGTYVDLIGTSGQPELRFDEGEYVDPSAPPERPRLRFGESDDSQEMSIVPFDDKRSIRRIILAEKDLKT